MSKIEKLIIRAKKRPRDLTYQELVRIMNYLGYIEDHKGKTSGSRVKFFRAVDESLILIHRPHPGDVLSPPVIDAVISNLERRGEI